MKRKKLIITLVIISIILNGCSNINQVLITDKKAEEALNIALEQEGLPYDFGGRIPPKFDCSGLITYSYKRAVDKKNIFTNGHEIIDDATMQILYDHNVQLIPNENTRPGDIVFITKEDDKITHGGLFIEWVDKYEKFRFINASSYHEEVVIGTWPVEGTKREQWFEGFGRLKISY